MKLLSLLMIVVVFTIAGSILHAADRVALVIGNTHYKNLQQLDACANDAGKMAAAFTKVGIRVHGGKPLIDLTADQMDAALNDFARVLGPESEAFIYYSGHGAQIGGANYLLQVGFDAKFESQARRQAVSLDSILELLERTDSRLRVVILDACRDAGEFLPGEPKLKGVHSKGLNEQQVEAPETLVCFATKHGTASLADDTDSFYSKVLAEEMVKPGEIGGIMRTVARRVYEATGKRQLPFTYGSLLQDHFFAPAPLLPAPFKPSPPSDPIAANKNAPFVNSLAQEFVPVPGTKVLFSRWDTRVRDWQAFIQEEGDAEQWGIYGLDEKEVKWVLKRDLSWKKPGFAQTGEHPVVGVRLGGCPTVLCLAQQERRANLSTADGC